MDDPTPEITPESAREAFLEHVRRKAVEARERHGPTLDGPAVRAILADESIMRYPTTLAFDAAPLQPGEFGFPRALGFHPSDGYALFLHPRFEAREETWAPLVAYHVPSINYGPIADAEAAELYGAALLGMEMDDYYELVCRLVDELG